MFPLIVSFFTNDWKYPQHAMRLRTECEMLKLPYRIDELPSTRSYLKNCCMKPTFIRDCLLEHKGPVLWLDVDASIYKKPEFFLDAPEEYDFQARHMGDHRKRTWHVGTMWWNYTPQTLEFIDRWIANTGECSDESALEITWREFPNLRTREIPKEYFQFVNRHDRPPYESVIAHRISGSPSKREETSYFKHYGLSVV